MNLIIKKDKVQYETHAARRPVHTGGDHARSARLIRAGGEPRAIEVHCACGEQFVIELEFEEPTP